MWMCTARKRVKDVPISAQGLPAVSLEGRPVESLQVERPVAPISFADSLREQRDLVARHPDRNPDHKRSELKPWLSAVGVKPFICCIKER